MSTNQLKMWESDFGNAYTDRNTIEWEVRLPAWKVMLEDLRLNHVLEVGPNRGHNLIAIAHTGIAQGNLIGIEPNPKAIEIARQSSSQISLLQGDAYSLPFVDGYADLVFTAGVLIHIALADLPRALGEIYRVSNRYILCAEYFAEAETTIEYRGHNDLLWKRNFRDHYLHQFSGLQVIKSGYWEKEHGFDQVNWWLFQK